MLMNAVELGSQLAQKQGMTKIVEAGAEKGKEAAEALFDSSKVIQAGAEKGKEAAEALFGNKDTSKADKNLFEKVTDLFMGGAAFEAGEYLAENI